MERYCKRKEKKNKIEKGIFNGGGRRGLGLEPSLVPVGISNRN
jgi:hypothetical protein